MKTRPLPDIDLARIASLPPALQRRNLEKMRDGRPPFSYKPFKDCLHDVFNVRPELFGPVQPTPWEKLRAEVLKRSKSDDEGLANLAVARGLYDFAINENVSGRSQEFFPLSITTGRKVRYWLSLILAIQDRPMVVFVDPRSTLGLTAGGRQFVFSMMHEHIRAADPDFENVSLGIFQFKSKVDGVRSVVLHTDDGVELIPYAALERMVEQTYGLWMSILHERGEESRRQAAGARGSLI